MRAMRSLVGITMESLVALLALLTSGILLSAVDGQGDGGCDASGYGYPDNINVLLDSWRYQTLLSHNSDSRVAFWHTQGSTEWYSQGTCENGSIILCSNPAGARPKTNFIYKSLPSSDTYPVRIFVNITYSFMDCPRPRCHHGNCHSRCSDYIYLRATYADHFNDTYIQNTSEASSDTKHIFFDLPTSVTGFDLELLTAEATCINVSRVLVYHYQCPEQIRPLYRPATQAPVSGSVLVRSNLTNICFSGIAVVSILTCTSEGKWLECDPGDNEFEYEFMCKEPENNSVSKDVEQLSHTVTSSPSSSPIPFPTTDQTVLIDDKKTVVGDTTTAEDCSCQQPTVRLAVVAVLVVIIFVPILVVVALILAALMGPKRQFKLKESDRNISKSADNELFNPVYGPMVHNIASSVSDATNENEPETG